MLQGRHPQQGEKLQQEFQRLQNIGKAGSTATANTRGTSWTATAEGTRPATAEVPLPFNKLLSLYLQCACLFFVLLILIDAKQKVRSKTKWKQMEVTRKRDRNLE
jgi:hypothetical protein